MHNFRKILKEEKKDRGKKGERVKKIKGRKKESEQLKKYLRLKFQDSLCAAEEHKVYQQSATGSLRGEIALSFAKKEKNRNVCFGLD